MPLVKVQHVNKVILGYGNLRDEEIEEGVFRISAILERNNNIFIRSLYMDNGGGIVWINF